MKLACPHCGGNLELELNALPPDSQPEQWRDVSIKDMELSTRAINCLNHGGLTTAGAIDEVNDKRLLGIVNFGRRTLWEVRDVIAGLKGETYG